MAILSTYKNELGIAELVSRQWPEEKRERLLKELEAANNKNKAEAALRQKRNLKLQRDINETILKVQEITTLDNKD